MATLVPGSTHSLQIWTKADHPTMPDIFELEDGRQIKISHAAHTDAERTRYAVNVATDGFKFRAKYPDAHRHAKGHAGVIYLHRPTGAWELYPVERTVSSHPRGTMERYGIHCKTEATKRQAAIELVNLSDGLQQRHCGWYQGSHTCKAGPWLITPLAKYADGTDLPQAPNSVRLDHDVFRHYVATHPKHGSIRVLAERLGLSYGYSLNCRVIPAPNLWECSGKIQQCPKRIERWIESRIRAV